MQNNIPKIPLFLSTLFFCVFIFASLYFYRNTNNNNTALRVAEEQWQTEMLRRDEIKALDRSVAIIGSERVQLETHFAQSSDVVPFLDTIEGLAPQSGVTAHVTSVSVSTDHTGLLVGMTATGHFEGLYKFLTLLENSPYELEFISMNMERVTGSDVPGGPEWNLILKMKLLTFTE